MLNIIIWFNNNPCLNRCKKRHVIKNIVKIFSITCFYMKERYLNRKMRINYLTTNSVNSFIYKEFFWSKTMNKYNSRIFTIFVKNSFFNCFSSLLLSSCSDKFWIEPTIAIWKQNYASLISFNSRLPLAVWIIGFQFELSLNTWFKWFMKPSRESQSVLTALPVIGNTKPSIYILEILL